MFKFPEDKTRLNQTERLVQEIVNEGNEMSIDDVAMFLYQEVTPFAQSRAQVLVSCARKLAATQYFIISHLRDTNGVYKLEDNAKHLYKQAQSSATRSQNGASRAKTIQAVLACDDSPKNQERVRQIQAELMEVVNEAAAQYLGVAPPRKLK